MKKIVILFILVFSGCGKKEEVTVSIAMVPQSSQVLETDAYSCQRRLEYQTDPTVAADRKAPTLSFKRLEIEWEKDTKLYLQVIKIVLTGEGLSGGKYSCTFGADEITALFEHAGNPTFNENTIEAKGTYKSNPLCRVTCGGIRLTDVNDPAISASGQMTLKGTEEDGDTFVRVRAIGAVRIIP